MMKQAFSVVILTGLVLFGFSLSNRAGADEAHPKLDDSVIFNVSSEDWVITKTARVTVSVEAAVSDKTAGTMRADMTKAVNDLAKTDWRLTSFSRSTDQTGLERWSTSFESRLPESDLNGLAEAAKRVSKAGMQISVSDIDFSPTLDETEAARAALRAKIYKLANDQLTTLNAALPGRGYRIAEINFTPTVEHLPMPMVSRGVMMRAAAMSDVAQRPAEEPAERSEKITSTATIVLSALAPVPTPAVAPAK